MVLKKMLECYKRDLERIEERIEELKGQLKKGGEGQGRLLKRIEILKDEKNGLLESVWAISDYINEVEKREKREKKKGAA